MTVGMLLNIPVSPVCRTCGTQAYGQRCKGQCMRCYHRAYAKTRRAGWLCADCAVVITPPNEYCARCAPKHR